MDLEPAAAPRIDIGKLSYFNGFPYLVTRLASAFYHIRLLLAEFSAADGSNHCEQAVGT